MNANAQNMLVAGQYTPPIAKLSEAMAKAFPEIEGALKDSTNPHFKSKYADLSSVVAAIKPALSKYGLWFRQVMHPNDNGVAVETVIHHSSGESLSCGVLFIPASKHDAQGFGSAASYCRRYSLQTAFGVCPEDDDGNAASGKEGKKDDPKGMPAKALEAALGAIQNAQTLGDLRKAHAEAWKAAGNASDQQAMDKLNAAKDARKAILEAQAA